MLSAPSHELIVGFAFLIWPWERSVGTVSSRVGSVALIDQYYGMHLINHSCLIAISACVVCGVTPGPQNLLEKDLGWGLASALQSTG